MSLAVWLGAVRKCSAAVVVLDLTLGLNTAPPIRLGTTLFQLFSPFHGEYSQSARREPVHILWYPTGCIHIYFSARLLSVAWVSTKYIWSKTLSEIPQ